MSDSPKFTTGAFRARVDDAVAGFPLKTVAEVLQRYEPDFAGVQPSKRVDRLYAIMKGALCLQSTGEVAMATLRRVRRSMVLEGALGHCL